MLCSLSLVVFAVSVLVVFITWFWPTGQPKKEGEPIHIVDSSNQPEVGSDEWFKLIEVGSEREEARGYIEEKRPLEYQYIEGDDNFIGYYDVVFKDTDFSVATFSEDEEDKADEYCERYNLSLEDN